MFQTILQNAFGALWAPLTYLAVIVPLILWAAARCHR